MPSVDKLYTKSNPGTIVNNQVIYKSKVLESGDLISLPDGILIKFVIDDTREQKANYLSTLGFETNE